MLGVSNSDVIMKFVQLHTFLSQNIGGTKDIVSPMSKIWGDISPLKLGPWSTISIYLAEKRPNRRAEAG